MPGENLKEKLVLACLSPLALNLSLQGAASPGIRDLQSITWEIQVQRMLNERKASPRKRQLLA